MTKKLVKILSIDGGGVRGLVPIHILAEIEKRTGKNIADLFDLIAGNSMGGSIAAQLVTPDDQGKNKYSADQIIQNFAKYFPKVMKKTWLMNHFSFLNIFQPKIDRSESEKMIKVLFGNTLLSETTTELLIPSFEIESDKPFIFKRWQAKQDRNFDFPLTDVVLATNAAPTFVSPHIVTKPNDPHVKHYAFIDGGIVANSPAICAYVEAKNLFPDATDFLIVSLGTGDYTAKMLLEKIHHWGISSWIPQIFDLLINSQGEIVDHELKTLLGTSADQLRHYFRIQFRLLEDEMAIDDGNPIYFHQLSLLAADVIKENEKQIQQICSLLVS